MISCYVQARLRVRRRTKQEILIVATYLGCNTNFFRCANFNRLLIRPRRSICANETDGMHRVKAASTKRWLGIGNLLLSATPGKTDLCQWEHMRHKKVASSDQQAKRERSREKPLTGPRTVAEICSGRKNSWARICTSSRVTASIDARISSSE